LPTIRVGLLGLGQVGQAVVRLADDRDEARRLGFEFRVERALVRDVARPRRCEWTRRVTDDPSAFMLGAYDVVIEAIGTIEPARTLVAQLLWRGTSVVTANKLLVAAHGDELSAIAAETGTSFRYEACALSAIPFIGTLARRPLVAAIDRVTAIVNGTSNFVLTQLAESGASFAEALEKAQDAGYAEPDPSRDIDGLDALDKLALLASLFGWGALSREDVEVVGISAVTADDLEAARQAGGVIKPVVSATRRRDGVEAFVGPAFVLKTEPLAAIGGALNGIRLDGKHVSNLFFSGPGAGPEVTAATLLDDAVEANQSAKGANGANGADRAKGAQGAKGATDVDAPVTSWFVRLIFPGVVPSNLALQSLLLAAGLELEQIVDHSVSNSRWLTLRNHSRVQVEAATNYLRATHRVEAVFIRQLRPASTE
jgi:homoserine dehydrogenase